MKVFNCLYCASEKFGQGKFCNSSCSAKAQIRKDSRIERKCLMCSTLFKTYISVNQMYCTRGCAKIGKESNFRGKKHTEQTKQKLKENALEKFKSKENHPRWLADRSKLRTQGGRRSSAYSIWRKEIYERDAFKCRIANNECSGRIEAHHILSYARYPSIRYEVNNGITLCKQHHPKTRDAETQLSPYFQDILKIKTH